MRDFVVDDAFSKFEITDEEAALIKKPEWIVLNVIVRGHMIMIPAEANGGKTTVCLKLADMCAAKGFNVIYMNADTSSADALPMRERAKRNGWRLLLPDLKTGIGLREFKQTLMKLAASGEDLSEYVFFLDTVKKLTPVISKQASAEFFKLLRALTGRGATVIGLAHINKYKDEGGMPIFEGTGDFRNDCDELIYFIPKKQTDGSILVSTYPDKDRAPGIQRITFRIAPPPDREVTIEQSYIDVKSEREQEQQKKDDYDAIEAIVTALKAKKCKQTEIIKFCKDEFNISTRRCPKILRRYSGDIWLSEQGFQNNSIHYWLNPEK